MIVNSSPLIIYGKLNKINIFLKLFKEIEIPEGVHQEVIIDGLENKFEDALILKNYMDDGKIKIIKLENKYLELANKIQILNNIGIGESQAIALARQLNRKELVIDEALARETAKSLGLNPMGSLKVMLMAYEKNLLNEKEVGEVINKMIKMKFRISAATLIRFWELFGKIKKK